MYASQLACRNILRGGPMKKWHMEGIIDRANNLQRKVVFGQRNQMFLYAGNYPLVETRRRASLLGCFRFFSTLLSRKS